MKLDEIRKKKPIQVYDPTEDARSSLEWSKERGHKSVPNGTLQLFVPRQVERYWTKKEREDHILRDKAKYAYDDEGNMIPQYKNWVNNVQESTLIKEAAPIIVGGNPKSGGDKPLDALLWTSTAKKLPDGKWTSDWNKFVQSGNASGSPAKIGYLYKVLPNTSVYELDTTSDAMYIYKIFATLGRPNTSLTDPEKWKREAEIFKDIMSDNEIEINLIKKDFPWNEIAKHFDCVHHWGGGRSYGFNYRDFTASYDVESTVWFKSPQLELLGQVPLWTSDDEREEY